MIKQNVTSPNLCLGGAAKELSVEAVGENITYQWYRSTTPSTSGGTAMVGERRQTLKISTQNLNESYYYCTVQNTCGTSTSNLSNLIKVIDSPKLIGQDFRARTICLGQTTESISVQAVGVERYTWNFTTSKTGIPETVPGNPNTNTLVLDGNNAPNPGYFFVELKNMCGTFTSSLSEKIELKRVPYIYDNSLYGGTFCTGNVRANLEVKATPSNVSYQWYRVPEKWDATPIKIEGAISSIYKPADVVGDTYFYCLVTNECGSTKSRLSEVVRIDQPITITKQPLAKAQYCKDSKTLPIVFEYTGTNLETQWSSAAPNSQSFDWISTPVFVFYTPLSSAVGQKVFRCYVKNACGAKYLDNVLVEIKENSFTITEQEIAGQTAEIGGQFSPVTIHTTGTVTNYQWYVNTQAQVLGGVAIAGQTTSTLTPLTDREGKRYYYCLVTGECGMKISPISGAFSYGNVFDFTQSTASQTVCEGQPLNALTITSSAQNLTYQWYKNTTATNVGGTSISGATSNSYVPSSNEVGKSFYYCIIRKGQTSATSEVSGVIKVNGTTSIVSEQIATQTVCPYYYRLNPLSVTAKGENLQYKWYESDNPSFVNATVKSFSTSERLNFGNATVSGTKYYYCEVIGQCGTVKSAISGPQIIRNSLQIVSFTAPAQKYCEGENLNTLNVIAVADNLTYQWYRQTTQDGQVIKTPMPNGTLNTYKPLPNSITGPVHYFCELTSACDTRNTNTSGNISIVQPITIKSKQLATKSMCKNRSFPPLNVTATGDNVTYQWYECSDISGSNLVLIPNATGSNFTPPSHVVGSKYYACKVSNPCEGVQFVSQAQIVLPDLSDIQLKMDGFEICGNGGTAFLEVATSNPNASFQWFKTSDNNYSNSVAIADWNSSKYFPPSINPGTFYYYCEVTSSCETYRSPVSGAIKVLQKLVPVDFYMAEQTICEGEVFHALKADYSGENVRVQWYESTTSDKSNGVAIPNATQNIFVPVGNQVGTKYYYYLVRSNCNDIESDAFMHKVSPKTKVRIFNVEKQHACKGSTFNPLQVTAEGENLTYQWYRHQANNLQFPILIPGATSATYTPVSEMASTNYYSCKITGRCGAETTELSGAIVVDPTTQITSESLDAETVGKDHQTRLLQVLATGSNLTYQWYKSSTPTNQNGQIIPGALSNSYTPPSDVIGKTYYYCLVTGDCGTARSSISGLIEITTNNGLEENFSDKLVVNVFPNPTNGLVNITNEQLDGAAILRDATGREIQKFTIESNNTQQLDLTLFPKGVYFLEIEVAHSKIKIVKKIEVM